MNSGWYEIPGSHPHVKERVNKEMLLHMIKEAEKKEDYERCHVLLKILQGQKP